jgi:hypothetical protein
VYVVRDVFRCQPGRALELAAMLRATIPSMEVEDGFTRCRVMVDAAGAFWTVVLVAEFVALAQFEHHLRTFGSRPDVRAAMAGYMDLVLDGRREILRVMSDG